MCGAAAGGATGGQLVGGSRGVQLVSGVPRNVRLSQNRDTRRPTMSAAVAAPVLATEYTLPLLCCPLGDLNSSPVCPAIPVDLQDAHLCGGH